jgi:hypothetical protein
VVDVIPLVDGRDVARDCPFAVRTTPLAGGRRARRVVAMSASIR